MLCKECASEGEVGGYPSFEDWVEAELMARIKQTMGTDKVGLRDLKDSYAKIVFNTERGSHHLLLTVVHKPHPIKRRSKDIELTLDHEDSPVYATEWTYPESAGRVIADLVGEVQNAIRNNEKRYSRVSARDVWVDEVEDTLHTEGLELDGERLKDGVWKFEKHSTGLGVEIRAYESPQNTITGHIYFDGERVKSFEGSYWVISEVAGYLGQLDNALQEIFY